MGARVILSKAAQKQVLKLPKHIVAAFRDWVETVELIGIREARVLRGRHDEPLKGLRFGQRSVRLSKAYRVIYEETGCQILILEVNKHEY